MPLDLCVWEGYVVRRNKSEDLPDANQERKSPSWVRGMGNRDIRNEALFCLLTLVRLAAQNDEGTDSNAIDRCDVVVWSSSNGQEIVPRRLSGACQNMLQLGINIANTTRKVFVKYTMKSQSSFYIIFVVAFAILASCKGGNALSNGKQRHKALLLLARKTLCLCIQVKTKYQKNK